MLTARNDVFRDISMNGEANSPKRAIFHRILSPWGIAIIILALFFLGQGYLAWRDRSVKEALESDVSFATPALDVAFSKKLPYDPLSFIGKGARAGLWQWTPEALVLTDEGRKFFSESGDLFVSHAAAGKREVKRIRINAGTKEGDRRVEFVYQWTEVSPPAAVLLNPPPRQNDDYPGQAVLTHEGGSWKVKSLRTQDFDDTLAHLKQAASGVLK